MEASQGDQAMSDAQVQSICAAVIVCVMFVSAMVALYKSHVNK